MATFSHQKPILIAEDDPDDRLLITEAITASSLKNPVHFVTDGVELMAHLKECCAPKEARKVELPGIILLDLNMPRKNGLEALAEIKSHEILRHIPVIVLSTTNAIEQVTQSYKLGANSFVIKPASFEQLVTAITVMGSYWFEVNTLPVK